MRVRIKLSPVETLKGVDISIGDRMNASAI